MKLMLAGQEFKSKQMLKQTVASILRATPLNTELHDPELQLLLALLQHHTHAAQKIGGGVRSIWVRATYADSCGFFIQRLDGTETDFSYVWCIKCLGHPAPSDDPLEAAFRTAVIDQKNAARDLAFATGEPIECPVTGELILRRESHVHHEPEFTTLVTAFLTERGLPREEVKIESGDGVMIAHLTDLELERAWRKYHQTHAHLVVVGRAGHVKIHQRRQARP